MGRSIPALALIAALLASGAVALHASATPLIRVGILRELDRVLVASDRPIELATGTAGRTTLPGGAYDVASVPGAIEVAGSGRYEPPVRFVPAPGARLSVDGKPYRGTLEVRRTVSGRLTIINELDLEEYLYGVVKMEVDPRWPGEALKAQAVAARTLALYSLNRFAAEGYDVRATTDSQVYGGIGAEDPRTTAAVEGTRGEIMTYQGQPIFAAFHSDSGGSTESSEYVWGSRYPYLKGVSDPYSTPSQQWVLRRDLQAFEEQLRRAGKALSSVTAIDVTETTPSGRVQTLRFMSAGGAVTVKGTELRTILGVDLLKSTLFTVRLVPDEQGAIEFSGRGAGHGVGMSQWGARGMASLGRTYQEILLYYYSGVTIEGR